MNFRPRRRLVAVVLGTLLPTATLALSATPSMGADERPIDKVARVNDLTVAQARKILTDPTAKTDAGSRLYYEEPVPDLGDQAGFNPTPDDAQLAPLSQTFLLHSKPGSQHVIYLDFDGAFVGDTQWNAPDTDNDPATSTLANGVHPAWDPDGNGDGFTDDEKTAVQQVWTRVAEDYAPFDIDVTTQDPGNDAINRTNAGDPTYGTRALITPSTTAVDAICGGGCGGVAYLDVFNESGNSLFQPAWVFPQKLSNDPSAIAEATSHEVGHNLALTHDGALPNIPANAYYEGHEPWAPIMGASYYEPITQFNNGTYSGANNQQDDLAEIAGNGAPTRIDEAGSTIATAGPLPTGTSYITDRTDSDVFALGGCTGDVTLSATGAELGANLDIQMQLLSQNGTVVDSANPPSAKVTDSTASGLNAAIDATVTPGPYFVAIDGVGNGNPSTGYDDYGSVGAYTLSQSGCGAVIVVAPTAPTSFTASRVGTSINLGWAAPASDGGSAVTAYEVRLDAGAWTPLSASTFTHSFAGVTNAAHEVSVRAVNSVGPSPAATANVAQVADLPGAPTSVTAARNGGSTTINWQPPATDGGSPITSYEGQIDGGPWQSVSEPTRSLQFNGTNNDAHTLAVRAVNAQGPGPTAQATVDAVTVVNTAPGALTNVKLVRAASGTSITVTFDDPASDGGSPLTGYEVRLDGGSWQPFDLTTAGVQFDGVSLAAHTISARALNAVGPGPETSATSPAVRRAPAAPRIGAARSGPRGGKLTATIAWAPTTAGSASINGFQVYAYKVNARGRITRTFTTKVFGAGARSAAVRLPKGRYRFAVRARNSVGFSPLSAKSGLVSTR